MALTCPQCASEMKEVRAEASTGYLIALDQCPRCGGIWCDRWELFPITAAAAQRLDAADQKALWTPVASADAEPFACPRCRARMRPFHDPAVPSDARIERCPNCEGMWLNRGELWRLKQHAAPPSPLASATPAQVDRLTDRMTSGAQPLPTVRNLDSVFDAVPDAQGSEDLRGEIAAGAIWLIIRAAVRLLVGL
jgi:Zn-finger nucleic acid-binding protein